MIALYVHHLVATGVVRNTLLLAADLHAAGHGVDLVTALPGGEPPPGVRHVALLGAPRRSRTREHLAAVPALRAYLRRERPALFVSMGNHGHATAWSGLRGLRDTPRVYRISNAIVRDAAGAPRDAALRRFARTWFATRLARDADRLVMTSAALLAAAPFAAAHRAGRAVVIVNGIDIAAARRAAAVPLPPGWIGDGVPVVLAIGRLAPQKNFATLIDAVARVQRQTPVRLVILGESRDAARDVLLAEAARRGIGDRVALPGTTDNVFAWLAGAAVFVLPSWWEGASNVLLEAVAVGTPIVASRTAGNAADVLDHDRFGRLVEPGDAAAMAAAIIDQLDPDRRRLPLDRAEAFTLDRTLAAWRRLVAEMVP